MRLLSFPLMFFLLIGFAVAQDAPAAMTADNIRSLYLAQTVRYDALAPLESGEAAAPLSGWFTLTPDGSRAAFVVTGGVRIVNIDDANAPVAGWVLPEATVMDAHWDDASQRLAVVYQHADGYGLAIDDAGVVTTYPIPVKGLPVRVWFDSAADNYVWLELTPAPEDADRTGFQVARLDLTAPDAAPLVLPTGPEHDFDSLVRIGRIPAPLAITATFGGTVRRWDLQTGEVTAEVQLPVAPTFGRVNETDGIAFAWRDESSTGLHLLNFETGENREISPLNGQYIQALLMTPDATVILAVHYGEDPTLTAWLTATGEKIDLGDYDTSVCSRVPDMVQLARSGTHLVIGCDAGYQVWNVG